MPTKPKTKTTDDDEVEAETAEEAVDPDHRFAGLADPPLSDPTHPDHIDWQHEHAGGPAPDELAAIKADQAKAAEAEAEARATVTEATEAQEVPAE